MNDMTPFAALGELEKSGARGDQAMKLLNRVGSMIQNPMSGSKNVLDTKALLDTMSYRLNVMQAAAGKAPRNFLNKQHAADNAASLVGNLVRSKGLPQADRGTVGLLRMLKHNVNKETLNNTTI